jgi:hypothetical protein
LERFIIREEHLNLLKRSYWEWWRCEFGSPAIDCKRPFGNSDVVADVNEILGVEYSYEQCQELVKELVTVMQIIAKTLTIETGVYVKNNPYGIDWIKEDSLLPSNP